MEYYSTKSSAPAPAPARSQKMSISGATPKRVLWKPSSGHVDSGSESHPLLSSEGSLSSRASFGNPCGIFDSETSDFEAPLPEKKAKAALSSTGCLLGKARTEATRRYNAMAELRLPALRLPELALGGSDGSGGAGGRGLAPSDGRGAGTRAAGLVFGVPDLDDRKLSYQHYFRLKSRSAPDLSLSEAESTAKRGNNSFVTIFSVWNTTVGTSLLALPWSVASSGLLLGILIILSMAGICLYTAWRLLQLYKLHGIEEGGDVGELCRSLVGRWAEWIARIFSLFVLLGAVLIYWILMSNFLYSSIEVIVEKALGTTFGDNEGPCIVTSLLQRTQVAANATFSDDEGNATTVAGFHPAWHLNYTVPLYLIVIAAPLLFFGTKFFGRFSALGTLSVIYVMAFVITKSVIFGVHVNIGDESSVEYTPLAKWTFPATTGLLALSFFIHNVIISIMRNNRHQENNGRDISIAYLLITFTYALIGILFYICFPKEKSCLHDNLLNNFPLDDPMTITARLFLFFQILSVFPLVSSLMRTQFFMGIRGVPDPGFVWRLVFNLVEVTLCVIFAVFFPHIGTVIRYCGAVSGFVYIFTIPVVLHLISLKQREKLTKWAIASHCWIPVFGLANLVAQFFIS